MKNLRIEYAEGQLVTVDIEGVSLLHAGLSGLSFSHFLGKEPHLRFEVGGEISGGPAPVQPHAQEPAQALKGELLPAETAPLPERKHNKNRYRNRSHKSCTAEKI